MRHHDGSTHDTIYPSPIAAHTTPAVALCAETNTNAPSPHEPCVPAHAATSQPLANDAPPADPPSAPTPASSISPVFNPEKPRNARGRFVDGARGNPHGRPRGSLNKSTLFARLVTEATTKDLTKKVIEAALGGRPAALKFCMSRLCSAPKDSPAPFDLPQTGSSHAGLLAAYDDLISRMAIGEITPRQAQSISRILEARRRCWESVASTAHRNEAGDRAEDLAKQSQRTSRADIAKGC